MSIATAISKTTGEFSGGSAVGNVADAGGLAGFTGQSGGFAGNAGKTSGGVSPWSGAGHHAGNSGGSGSISAETSAGGTPAEHAGQSNFGAFASVTPFSYRYCACRQAVADSRDLVESLARSTRTASDALAETIRLCSGIDWTGNAANLFRERLGTVNSSAISVADHANTAAHVALLGGGS